MAAQWPLVVEKLLAVFPTLTGWGAVDVFDGPPVTSATPPKYVTVGFVPPDDHAGSYTILQAPDGFRWHESGSVRCRLVCADGGIDLAQSRIDLFALADVFEAWIRADRTLGGVLSKDSTVDVTTDVHSDQNTNGSGQAAVFTVAYTTVT